VLLHTHACLAFERWVLGVGWQQHDVRCHTFFSLFFIFLPPQYFEELIKSIK
jgi:hypothetical protein